MFIEHRAADCCLSTSIGLYVGKFMGPGVGKAGVVLKHESHPKHVDVPGRKLVRING